MLSLSRRGSDAVTLREFDIDAKAFARDSFVLPEAKRDTEWIDPDTLVLSSSYGRDMAATSGYARTVRLWRRGTGADQAPVIFDIAADHGSAHCNVDHTVATARMWFVDQVSARPGSFALPSYTTIGDTTLRHIADNVIWSREIGIYPALSRLLVLRLWLTKRPTLLRLTHLSSHIGHRFRQTLTSTSMRALSHRHARPIRCIHLLFCFSASCKAPGQESGQSRTQCVRA